MVTEPHDVVIVGAGVAGLTLAERLAAAGADVLLLEAAPVVGGLARSYSYEGGFRFDVGPHRFHADAPATRDYILSQLGDDRLWIERRSAVWMFGRYIDWPLRIKDVLRMPPAVVLAVARDLLWRRRNGCRGAGSFADYVRRHYGPTLQRIFFEPYSQKFLGRGCAELDAEWAVTGIERATIDPGYRAFDLEALVRSALAPPPPLRMIYPASGAIDVFARRLARRAQARGATLRLAAPVDGVELARGRVMAVRAARQRHRCDLLVWTGRLDALAALLGLQAPRLEYAELSLFNYRVRHGPRVPYQWCYFPDPALPFVRASIPSRFNAALAPAGCSGICVEVALRADVAAPQEPAIRQALVAARLLRSPWDVLGVAVERVPAAYPVYTRGYRQRLAPLLQQLDGVSNLQLLGRQARFWYNNMDHSIGAALGLAARLTARVAPGHAAEGG